jgi:small-conductance mechanosensitive channel
MSKLLTVLYEVAEIRAGCQRVHDERFGLSARSVLRAITGRPSGTPAAQCAELRHLAERLEQARERLDELEAEDLAIRSGHEINATLRDYVSALARSLSDLEQLCRHEHAVPAAPAGDDSAPLKVAYDDALQQQKRLATRLNALISGL